jgi:hypothetical protein
MATLLWLKPEWLTSELTTFDEREAWRPRFWE